MQLIKKKEKKELPRGNAGVAAGRSHTLFLNESANMSTHTAKRWCETLATQSQQRTKRVFPLFHTCSSHIIIIFCQHPLPFIDTVASQRKPKWQVAYWHILPSSGSFNKMHHSFSAAAAAAALTSWSRFVSASQNTKNTVKLVMYKPV